MTEINFSEIIDTNLMLIKVEAKDKNEIIHMMTDKLYREGAIDNKEKFLTDVYLREKEGETGIGQGVAIPHGKSESVVNTKIAIATLKEPISWESLDGEKVDVIFMFAVKNTEANTKHIILLQQVAILLANDDFISKMSTVQNETELVDLITENQ